MEYAIAYLTPAALFFAWFLSYAYIGMDGYDRRYIRWGETLGMVFMSALLWPLIVVRKPSFLKQPSEMYEWDSSSARIARERDRVRHELKRCSNRVRFETKKEGVLIGEFEFPAEMIARYLTQRTDKDGYGSLADLPEIQAWVNNADYMNGQASEVPWVWGSFNLLATELIGVGVGNCFCGTCRTHYENWELESGSGNGSPGWIAVIVKCPKGHEVMKFDLMKPFCSHRRHPEPEPDPVAHSGPHVPSFLKKGK